MGLVMEGAASQGLQARDTRSVNSFRAHEVPGSNAISERVSGGFDLDVGSDHHRYLVMELKNPANY